MPQRGRKLLLSNPVPSCYSLPSREKPGDRERSMGRGVGEKMHLEGLLLETMKHNLLKIGKQA